MFPWWDMPSPECFRDRLIIEVATANSLFKCSLSLSSYTTAVLTDAIVICSPLSAMIHANHKLSKVQSYKG